MSVRVTKNEIQCNTHSVLWRNNLRSLVEDLVDSVWAFQSLWKQQCIRWWTDF